MEGLWDDIGDLHERGKELWKNLAGRVYSKCKGPEGDMSLAERCRKALVAGAQQRVKEGEVRASFLV